MTAPSVTGSITDVQSSSNSSSQSITAPADATFCLVMVAWWETGVPDFSSLTYGGASFTKVIESATDSDEESAIYRASGFSTGSQTFAWTWASGPTEGAHMFVVFLKDVNLAAPITDSDTAASSSDPVTPAINTTTNDTLFVVGSGFGVTSANAAVSGQSEIADGGNFNSVYGVVGQKAGSAGTTTMTVDFSGSGMANSICACSVAGSTGGRTTKNTDSNPLGVFTGVSRRVNNAFHFDPKRKFFIPNNLGKIMIPA